MSKSENKKTNKSKVIMSLAVVILGTALFGNWYLSNNDVKSTLKPILSNETTTSSEKKNLGEATYVDGKKSDNKDENEYFTKTRIERQQARDSALEELNNVFENDKAGDEAKKVASEKIGVISQNITAENKIESLVKAKGISNCLAVIGDESCEVAVEVKELDETLILQIKEIVMNQMKINYEKISIIQVK